MWQKENIRISIFNLFQYVEINVGQFICKFVVHEETTTLLKL